MNCLHMLVSNSAAANDSYPKHGMSTGVRILLKKVAFHCAKSVRELEIINPAVPGFIKKYCFLKAGIDLKAF